MTATTATSRGWEPDSKSRDALQTPGGETTLSPWGTDASLLHGAVTGVASTYLFLSAILSSGVIYSRRKRSGFIFGCPAFHRSLTPSPAGDAGSAVAARVRRFNALRPPHLERSHQSCPATPGPRWSSAGPAGPGPTSLRLCPALPTPTQVAAPQGRPGGGSAAGLLRPLLLPAAPQPPKRWWGKGEPSPAPRSCPTSGAAGPLSSPGKSSRLRVGHQGLPWVVAWLKGGT